MCCFLRNKKAIGGVLTLNSRKWLRDSNPLASEIVEGRVVRTTVKLESRTIVLWSVHNFDLTTEQVNEIAKMVESDEDAARCDPLRNTVVLASDVKFCPEGECGFDIENTAAGFATKAENHVRQNSQRWLASLAPFTDAHAWFLTHWFEQRQTASGFDGIYFSSPGWLVTCMRVEASTLGDPLERADEAPAIVFHLWCLFSEAHRSNTPADPSLHGCAGRRSSALC